MRLALSAPRLTQFLAPVRSVAVRATDAVQESPYVLGVALKGGQEFLVGQGCVLLGDFSFSMLRGVGGEKGFRAREQGPGEKNDTKQRFPVHEPPSMCVLEAGHRGYIPV